MAKKRQKKKNARSYEGGQYRGGRASGRKNLIKADGGVINQHGVFFSNEQKKALESAVNTANRKRAKMLKQEATLPRKIGGVDTGDTQATLQLMGKESDFILARKTKSLQRFNSMEEFNRYMSNLSRVNSRDYITERVKLYKRNYMTALEREFGDAAKDVKMKVRMMKPTDFMRMVQSDELLEIGFIYDDSQKSGRLNQIRAGFGMKLKEEEIEDYDE